MSKSLAEIMVGKKVRVYLSSDILPQDSPITSPLDQSLNNGFPNLEGEVECVDGNILILKNTIHYGWVNSNGPKGFEEGRVSINLFSVSLEKISIVDEPVIEREEK
jgi:hypothetical protein